MKINPLLFASAFFFIVAFGMMTISYIQARWSKKNYFKDEIDSIDELIEFIQKQPEVDHLTCMMIDSALGREYAKRYRNFLKEKFPDFELGYLSLRDELYMNNIETNVIRVEVLRDFKTVILQGEVA